MTSTRWWIAATLTAASLGLGWPSSGLAQDKPKDEVLEKLLEKLEQKDKAELPKDQDKDKPKDGDKEKPPKDQDKDKPKDGDKEKAKPPGEVAPKDEALDKLLEGLGQTRDTPAPDDKKPGAPSPDGPTPPKGDQPKPEDLKGGEKDLDKELERITGKKEKPKNQKDRKGEDEGGPLGQVIKEMRDVEERLGKPDTGEETRKKQMDIVKNLDGLIEQMKNAPSQSMGLKMIRDGKKPGPPQQPGQPGTQPGAMANGPPPTKPSDPKKAPLTLDLVKSMWGQLPAQVRDDIGNVMNERPLPTREDLIRLYYLSLGKKNSDREE